MSRARVLLADDHAIVAEGLAALLREEFELVGTVADGTGLVAAASRTRPDVVVTDISMPGLSGLEAVRRLRDDGVNSRVVVLTMHADANLAAEALRAGATGYVLKQSAGEELLTAIRDVLAGRVYLAAAIAGGAIAAVTRPNPPRARLTPRQMDVLRLVGDGRSVKQIAAALGLSPRTVETHKYEMMQALGLRTTAELIRYAIDHPFAS